MVEESKSGVWVVRGDDNCYTELDHIKDEPKWSNYTFIDLLNFAFEHRTITDKNDPLVKTFTYRSEMLNFM